MVHGDIREANIVFTEDSSHLIDFDLARMENDTYPNGYVGFPERHENAIPGGKMLKIHDKHALFKIITKYFHVKKDLNLVEQDLDNWMSLLT